MIGLGTIINVGAIIIGGLCGLFLGRSVKVRYQDILMISVGICVMMLGIGGTMEKMLSVKDGVIVSGGSMMMIITMAVGALIGEWMDIEGKMEQFGIWLTDIDWTENAPLHIPDSVYWCHGDRWFHSGWYLWRLQYPCGKGDS